MDLLVDVGRPSERELTAGPITSSDSARSRVAEARERQRARLDGCAASCNGEMDARTMRRHVALEEPAEQALARAYSVGALSARGRHRILRVARTIADLEGHERVSHQDLLTALGLRQQPDLASAA
ncbi:MAG: magnesium chelatase subunit ChlI family protein [Solirubrobacteraceae bacterium]